MSQGVLFLQRREYARQMRLRRLFDDNQKRNTLRQRLEGAATADAARTSGAVPDVPWDENAPASEQPTTVTLNGNRSATALPPFDEAVSFDRLCGVAQNLLA